jgi:serine/threonine-protein kinase
MVPTNANQLAEELRKAELLTRQQLTQIVPILAALSDPQEFAFALVQKGWLTSFQAEQALAGKCPELVFGGYVLQEQVGIGGMGLVYKALQQRLKRTVAIKVIKPELVDNNPASIERFRREALAVARLSHPNIVVIYDANQSGNIHYLVMEFADGPDLGRLVRETGPLPIGMACDFVRQASLGLQHAYESGLVHRDIKPSNLLVARRDVNRKSAPRENPPPGWNSWWDSLANGVVKILDMGLARIESMIEIERSLTHEGAMLGTPDYVAPEQARDASTADIRADIYSLGCTLYYLLAGRPPFPDGTMIEKLMRHQMELAQPIESLRTDVSPQLASTIRMMMAKEPSHRQQTPNEVAQALAMASNTPSQKIVLESPVVAGVSAPRSYEGSPATVAREFSILKPSAAAVLESDSSNPDDPSTETEPAVAVVTAHSLQSAGPTNEQDNYPRLEAKKLAVLRAHSGPVMALAMSPDCKMLATGGLDRCVRLWYLSQPPREQAQFQEPQLGDLQRVAFSPNGEIIVTGSSSFDAKMWCWHWRKSVSRDRFYFEGVNSYSDSLAFSPDGGTVASAVGESINQWSITDDVPKKRSALRVEGADARVVVFSPDNKKIAAGQADGGVQVWKVGWLGSRPMNKLKGHADCVTCLSYSTDCTLLASAAKDHTVRIWDGTGASETAKAIIPEIRGVVRQLMFLPDAQFLLTLSDAGQAIVWTWANGQRVCEWKLNQSIICSLALASDGGTVAAGSSDGSVTVYDLTPE